MSNSPNFIIVGAMKCATSTLHEQLALQPGIFMTEPKEPYFFSNDEVYARGTDWYLSLFKDASENDLCGESSTHYTKLPTYPETVARMSAVLASPRLVYMVRDPIERAVSHFIHEWTEGRMTDSPEEAFERVPELVEYGLYARQLAPFIDRYGRDAICLTSLERLTADPQGELARICGHIGLAARPVWRAELGAQNVSAERIRKLPLHGLIVDNPVATALRRALVPKAIRQRVREARSYGKRPEVSAGLRARLADRFAADQAELSALFPGVDLTPRKSNMEVTA